MQFYLYLCSLVGKNRKHSSKIVCYDSSLPTLRELLDILMTFVMVMISWVFFRSPSIIDALVYIKKMFVGLDFSSSYFGGLPYVAAIILFDWITRKDERAVFPFENKLIRWTTYLAISIFVLSYLFLPKQSFIYFQF